MCHGTQGAKWDTVFNMCTASSPGSFCDEVTKSTCYIGRSVEFELEEGQTNVLEAMKQAEALVTAEVYWDPAVDQNKALVRHVGSEWEADGLQVNDRLVTVDGEVVTETLLEELWEETDPITALVWRQGSHLTLTLRGAQTDFDKDSAEPIEVV